MVYLLHTGAHMLSAIRERFPYRSIEQAFDIRFGR